MRRSWGLGLASALLAACLAITPTASASAVEIGSNCQANSTSFDGTLVQLSAGPDALLPISVPTAGVLTSWKINLGSISSPPVVLKILEPGGFPNDWHVVAEGPVATLVPGQNSFESRFKVDTGYRLGLYAPNGQTPFCGTAFAQDVIGRSVGDAKVDSTHTFAMEDQAQLPVSARIEPDADGDGYGDETQDQCPQSASTQAACPTLDLDAFPIVKRNAVVLLLRASAPAHVLVSAEVARRPPAPPFRVGVSCCPAVYRGIVPVVPGSLARVRLLLYRGLRSTLHSLSAKKSKKLVISISASADDGIGPSVEKTIEVKLPGQANSHKSKGKPGQRSPQPPYAQGRARATERSSPAATLPG
jgi:hypothetical protein